MSRWIAGQSRVFPSDAELIQQCLAGQPTAWEALLSRYERLIYYTALRAGANADEASDVFQAVCLIWLEELGRLRNARALGAWLVTTTRRECWARWKRRGGNEDELDDAAAERVVSDDSPEKLAAQAEDAHAVRGALQQLAEPCRRLLWLLYYDPTCPSYAAVARKLKMPANSLGPTRARCLSKLGEILREAGWGEGTN
ncbi:MAG: sigma-70 family RNA polymerase sigma factor [Chloroflexi bacterium]|nr:sigma-70 family RNA polymerase sigma factor [Chloroflexota bacterium]